MKARIALTILLASALSLGNALARSGEKPCDVYACWYKVPVHSLAHRRAGPNEFTAAHNHLPLGTLVRLTNTQNNCSVVVRITDRGITNRRAKIDICKEAAEELGIVRKGIVRVRMEILPDPPAMATTDAANAIAH